MEKKTFWQWFANWQRLGFVIFFNTFLILWFGINLADQQTDFWSSDAFIIGSIIIGATLIVFIGGTYKTYKDAKKRGDVL